MGQQNLYSVVLAAGQSERFGSTKQLAELRGVSLVRRALDAALDVTGAATILVVGADWHRVLRACLPFDGFFVRNENFGAGLGSSVATGVGAAEGIAGGILLVLADQPLITADMLWELHDRWSESPDSIVASRYAEVLGAPAIFPARCFDMLRRLEGDRGARALLNSGSEDVIAVKCEAAAIDIDTPDELEKLR